MNEVRLQGKVIGAPEELRALAGVRRVAITLDVPRGDSIVHDRIRCEADGEGLADYVLNHCADGTTAMVLGQLNLYDLVDKSGQASLFPIVKAHHVSVVRTEPATPFNEVMALPDNIPDDPHDMWADSEAGLPF